MDYIQKARRRASRRKSPWNLLLIPLSFAFLLAIFLLLVTGIEAVHGHFHPEQSLSNGSNSIASIFAHIPLFFIAIPLGFFLANVVAWLIPPMRRVLDAEAANHPGAGFLSSQLGLLKLAVIATAALLPISLFSAALSW